MATGTGDAYAEGMPHTLTEYDDVTRRVAGHERATLHSLAPFALVVVLITLLWMAFVEYL